MALATDSSPGPFVMARNHGPDWRGWLRCTVDQPLPFEAGEWETGGRRYRFVGGRAVGRDTRVVDVWLELKRGEYVWLDLSSFSPAKHVLRGLPSPAEALSYYGGPTTLGGKEMRFVSGVQPDGAAWLIRMRSSEPGSMMRGELWFTWYPDQPCLLRGELVVTASNPMAPESHWDVPADFRLRFGDGVVAFPGRGIDVPVFDPQVGRLKCGQARAVPVAIGWPRHFTDGLDWSSAGCAAEMGAWAVGCDRVLPEEIGQPRLRHGTEFGWAEERIGQALKRLHTWEAPVTGPNPRSADTGAQTGEQVFVRGEAIGPNREPHAACVAYLSALKIGARPCHFLEHDGEQARWQNHPNAVTWDGRPHYSLSVSPDRLGAKPLWESDTTYQTPSGTVKWMGPDRQHWMCNTLAAAARLTGSPALQWLLSQQAQLFMMGETVPSLKPNWPTSGTDSPRAVGYAGMLAVRLYQDLEDRQLAEDVKLRYQKRVEQVYVPVLGKAANDTWEVWTDHPNLGPGKRWQPWQQAIGAYGLYEACRYFGLQEGMAVAVRGAKRVLTGAMRIMASPPWVSLDAPTIDGSGQSTAGFYDLFGIPLAMDVLLLSDPSLGQVREIRASLAARATQEHQVQWFSPAVTEAEANRVPPA